MTETDAADQVQSVRHVVYMGCRFRVALGLVVCLVALTTLIGWHLDNDALISLKPFRVPMEYNTALGLLLSGIALSVLANKERKLLALFGIAVMCLGCATFFQYIAGIDIHIDQMLAPSLRDNSTSYPGRMSPSSAVCFVLVGACILAACLSEYHKELDAILGIFGTAIADLGLVGLLDHVLDPQYASGWGNLKRMAANTALCFCMLGSGFTFTAWVAARKKSRERANLMLRVAGATNVVFLLDLCLPAEIVLGWAYVIPLLFCLRQGEDRTAGILALLSVVLIATGVSFAHFGAVTSLGIILGNYLMALIAVGVLALTAHEYKVMGDRQAELRHLHETLEKSAAELARSNQDLERFAYFISHELQEPLRMVSSFVGLLAKKYEGQLDDDADDFIGFAIEGSDRMRMMIKGLLSYSRVRTKDATFALCSTDEILAGVLKDISLQIEEAGAIVTSDPLPSIHCDPGQIAQLLHNLIENAIKFQNGSVPEVHISARLEGDFFIFSVKDNGVGIAPENLEIVFGLFERLHSKKRYPGTGIGLAICESIVRRHGGEIWVKSVPGFGSTFFFTIGEDIGGAVS